LAFTEELRAAGIAGSIGTVGDALDNALMESTIGLYKTELIDQRAAGLNWLGRREVERETAEWVQWFNTEKIHSSLDYVTPIEREIMFADTLAQRAEAA
jgi:transposase InsO family protein